jgi:hypothetical protein
MIVTMIIFTIGILLITVIVTVLVFKCWIGFCRAVPSLVFKTPGRTYPRRLPVQLTVYPGHYGILWVERWQVLIP